MKKGFTLIELLATIVVIAIIALITIPVISGVISKARLNALKDSAYGLIEASDLYYAQYGSNNVRFDIEDSNITSNDTDKLLSYKGSIKTGVVIINSKGKSTICITDGENSAYKNYDEEQVTLVSKKTCTVPSNSNIVYLDGDRTKAELSNLELTERLLALESSKINVDDIYPVGSIYLSVNNENPSIKFGGTWVRYAEGKTLVGVNGDDTVEQTGGHKSVNLTTANIPTLSISGTTNPTGSGYKIGYASASRTTSSNGNHNHTISYANNNANHLSVATGSGADDSNFSFLDSTSKSTGYRFMADYNGNHTHTVSDYYANSITGIEAHTHAFTGVYTNDDQTKVNVQDPYITVYMWKRTA